jgi:hypothetical protein
MAKKANNYFVKVAKYQKEHPRATRDHAMKMVSKSIAGPKKKTTVKVVKRTPPKTYKRGNSTGPSQVHTGTLTISGRKKKSVGSPIVRGVSISRKIDDLELLLKNTTGAEAKNKIKRLINAEHDKLDAITKNLKIA